MVKVLADRVIAFPTGHWSNPWDSVLSHVYAFHWFSMDCSND